MNAPMPQKVVDRVLAFMLTEKTGRIEFNFRKGRLHSVNVSESLQFRDDSEDTPGLDESEPVAQDSPS
jgi:hypothetical protein